jgi:hypothetical protein
VFDDPSVVLEQDQEVEGEQRWSAIGWAKPAGGPAALLLFVAHTAVDEAGAMVIRIISARAATRRERRLYEERQSSS